MFKSGLLQQANEIGLDIQVTGPPSMPYLTFKGCLISEGFLNLFYNPQKKIAKFLSLNFSINVE